MPESTNIAVADKAHPDAAPPPPDLQPPPSPRDDGGDPCPNCGENFRSRFCPDCGERRVAGEDRSLRRFLGEAFNILTNVESNLFRSFATLLTRPGRLTVEYFKGRRKSYLKPLQLFIFCNVIFFFAHSYVSFNTLTTPLYVHLYMLPHQRLARHMVDSELRARNITYDAYRPRFDATTEGQAKTLVIVMVPLYALALQLFYWRTRRYYVEHLIFSLHFYAFLLLLIAGMHVGLYVMLRARHLFGSDLSLLQHDGFVSLVMLLLCGTHLFFALRRAYGQGRVVTALKCFVLAVGIFGVIHVYRFILFFTTFYAI